MTEKRKYIIVLNNIRSLQNVGALFRSVDGAGFDRIILAGYTPTPPRKDISKTALWAEEWIPWEYHENALSYLQSLPKNEWAYIALEKNQRSQSIHTLDIPSAKNICLIVGNEVDGVEAEIQNIADAVAHIPMLGRKTSLNVSVAASIALYHFWPCRDSL